MFSRSDGRTLLAAIGLALFALGWHLISSPQPATTLLISNDARGEGPQVIDLNRASAEELTALPGIGSELAARIVRHRLVHGPFRSLEDLLQVPGIGPRTLEVIRARANVRVCRAEACH